MLGKKILLVIFLLSDYWALAPADVDDEYVISNPEEAQLSYGFEEKLDKLTASVDLQEKNMALMTLAFSKIQEKFEYLKQAIEQSPRILTTAVGETTHVKPNVLEVKCPNDRLPESCVEVNECKTDVYSIMIPSYSNHSLAVSCDLKTEDGGWTVIQRRQDGSVDFYRNWTEYVEGFGDISGEFFIGLEKLHFLTTQEDNPQELYIILEDFEGERRYAKYQTFIIDSSDFDYKLTVDKYSGSAGDSLEYHSGEKFSTWDRDNDSGQSNCAEKYKGAWWHKSCYESNLNGKYLMGKLPKSKSGQGISWNDFRGYDYSLKWVQMMIRPRED